MKATDIRRGHVAIRADVIDRLIKPFAQQFAPHPVH